MTNQEKGRLYDQYLRESDALQLANSRLKSQYVLNTPQSVQKIIDENNAKIGLIIKRLENLYL
jgi:hypothetical protein